MRQRPRHLRNRPITPATLGETVELITIGGDRQSDGTWKQTETRSTIIAATAPPSGDLSRSLSEAGVQLDGARQFWTQANVRPAGNTSPGDIIVWRHQRWRTSIVRDWGDFLEVLAIREEAQAET